jgi:hypothetical protein
MEISKTWPFLFLLWGFCPTHPLIGLNTAEKNTEQQKPQSQPGKPGTDGT